jgi:coatomer subunit delta
MVVILSAVTSKSGKALFARQFTEMTRVRVEGLLSAFPKLMDTSSQRTYVETESVRYVYQPMEKLYLLLITNKSSNIIEDLDTLQLLSVIIKDKIETISEEEVLKNAYELMFAFDEVINLGYREYLALDQVNTILEMDSHEEALQKLIYDSKIDDGLRVGREAESRIKKTKKDGIPSGRMKGISSSDLGMTSSGINLPDSPSDDYKHYNSNVGVFKSETKSSQKSEIPKKSLKLGSSKKKVSLLENLVQQGEVQREEEDEEEIVVVEQKKNIVPTEK